MIDLHCHMAPGLDDGARDLDTALRMAEMAMNDGIVAVVCTPHITPGVYNNSRETIEAAVARLREVLLQREISLHLFVGADVQMAPGLSLRLATGIIPSIAGSRYFLFEPPHHAVPPRIEALAKSLIGAGFVPVLTHPERLGWIESHYEIIHRLSSVGALIQLTAGSVSGAFGRRAQYWSERLLDEGLVDLIASDAHNTGSRPPILSRARDMVAQRLGEEEALRMVVGRPAAMLADEIPAPRLAGRLPQALGSSATIGEKLRHWLQSWHQQRR